jgi:hypothetical protein
MRSLTIAFAGNKWGQDSILANFLNLAKISPHRLHAGGGFSGLDIIAGFGLK